MRLGNDDSQVVFNLNNHTLEINLHGRSGYDEWRQGIKFHNKIKKLGEEHPEYISSGKTEIIITKSLRTRKRLK